MSSVPEICEANIRGECRECVRCDRIHLDLPYLWQLAEVGTEHWYSLPLDQCSQLEQAFCDVKTETFNIQVSITHADNLLHIIPMSINFLAMQGQSAEGKSCCVRRLSTPSYITMTTSSTTSAETCRYHTQWRWYWCADVTWKLFGVHSTVPTQSVLEAKFVHKQQIYRFEVDGEDTFLVDLRPNSLRMKSVKSSGIWLLRRRPIYVSEPDIAQLRFPEKVEIKRPKFSESLPVDWAPLDTSQECEMVALNPDSGYYHVVASAFFESVSHSRRVIHDIFRIQNAFLWHKYVLKKEYMEHSGRPLNERQLYHGTKDDHAVQAIIRQNFDWRLNGTATDTVYGKGIYFAANASYSDKFALCSSKLSWMFMARVLVGTSAIGSRELVRPPPRDPMKPYAALYDSCVDSVTRPAIYVIFDSDQCYPEYLISYSKTVL